MESRVIYDSTYGNTAALAEAIGTALGSGCRVVSVAHASWEDFAGVELLVVGSPTQGGRPTAALKQFLDRGAPSGLAGMRVAAFDTRLDEHSQRLPLRLLMKVIGYASPRILRRLVSQGGVAVEPAAAFIVDGKEGPLREGELQRAADWAHRRLASG